MPRTSIAIQSIPYQKGATITLSSADATNGMMVNNNGELLIYVRNAGGTTVNVTIVSVPDQAGRTGDFVVGLAPGAFATFGPFEPAWWNQTSGADLGKIYVNFASGTSMTVGAAQYK